MKHRFLYIMALLLTVATGAVAQNYKVSVKEGTEDASNWQGKAGEGEYQALPLTGLEAGTAVSVKYNGTKKVKSVKAKAYKMAAEATSADKGKLICTDGHIHAYGADAACTKARVAKIIYIGTTDHATYTHGLALALTDEGKMAWESAKTACNTTKNTSTPVTDATWLLASYDQWRNMLGTDGASGRIPLRDGFSSVGGSNMQSDWYWSSTESDSDNARRKHFGNGSWEYGGKGDARWVRACLAFGAQGSDPDLIELTSTDGETWTLASMPDTDVELEVTYYTDAELDQMAADEVIAKITAIGTVTYTPESKALIDAARTAYDALTAAQQARVTNYSTLTDAETTYATAEVTAYNAGVELTKNPDGTWTHAATPAFDVELEMEYYTELKDDETIDYSAIGSTADIWLSRTLKTGSWNTFASPVAIDADQLTALGITAVKQLGTSSFSEGVLTLNFTDATAIEAGKPYLVKVSADKEIGAFDGATVSGTPTATETTAADFIPTLGATTITGDDANDILFLGSGNKLLHPGSLPANMKGFRAYFQLKGEAAEARSFRMDFGDGEATGIISIGQLDNLQSNDWYDLSGRKLSNGQLSNRQMKKGIYIQNGKKVVIK